MLRHAGCVTLHWHLKPSIPAQVLDGGENLLEVVDKLAAKAAAQEAALQAQKAAEAASVTRIAQLEEEQMHSEEQYSSVQVSITPLKCTMAPSDLVVNTTVITGNSDF